MKQIRQDKIDGKELVDDFLAEIKQIKYDQEEWLRKEGEGEGEGDGGGRREGDFDRWRNCKSEGNKGDNESNS